MPTVGAAGAAGTAFIITLFDEDEVHPVLFVTVKLWVPWARSVIVVLVPVPVTVPGSIVHVPVDGSPFNTTLPVVTIQVGWVIVPTAGADGVTGAEFIITADGADVHPVLSVTVKL